MPLPVDSRNFFPAVTASHTSPADSSDTSPEMHVWENIEAFFCSEHQHQAHECVRKICHPPAGMTREDVASRFELLRMLAFSGYVENFQSGRYGDNHFCILDADSGEILSVFFDDAGNYKVEYRQHVELHVLTGDTKVDLPAKAEPEALSKADFEAVWLTWVGDEPRSESTDRQEAASRMLSCLNKRVQELDLSDLNLGVLPGRLPPGITELNLSRTSLTSLPPLPPGLKILRINENQLTSLPELPPELSELHASYNNLTSLPKLPSEVRVLILLDNELTYLPELPSDLEKLDVSNNSLRELPELPWTLLVLNVGYNCLTHLPALPAGIRELILVDNELTYLPELPSGIRELDIGLNQLNRPPESIERLSSDAEVDITSNPLSAHALQALCDITGASDYSGPRILFSMSGPSVTPEVRALKLAVADWLPHAGKGQQHPAERWQTFEQEDDSAAFSGFLDRLCETENFRKNLGFKADIASWLTQLADDSELRAKTFAMAREATSSCEDRVTLALNLMKNVQLVNNAERGTYDDNITGLFAVGREMFRLEKLEEIARAKVNTLKFVDEIEVWLGYQSKLRTALKLTSVTAEMRFFGESYITKADLKIAEDQVKTAEDAGFSEWVLQWEALRRVLERTQTARMEALTAKKRSDYNAFYTRLYQEKLQPLGLDGDTDAERDIGKRALIEAEKAYMDGLRSLVMELAGVKLGSRWHVTEPGSSSSMQKTL